MSVHRKESECYCDSESGSPKMRLLLERGRAQKREEKDIESDCERGVLSLHLLL